MGCICHNAEMRLPLARHRPPLQLLDRAPLRRPVTEDQPTMVLDTRAGEALGHRPVRGDGPGRRPLLAGRAAGGETEVVKRHRTWWESLDGRGCIRRTRPPSPSPPTDPEDAEVAA